MFLDIGIGILAAVLVSKIFVLPLSLGLVFVGVIFALLPDLDFILYKAKKDLKNIHKHRNLLHYPLLYIPIGVIVILFFSKPLTILFGICSLLHFIHDSIGIGWGIKWFFPFSKNSYSFLNIYQPPNKEQIPKAFLHIWKDEEMDMIVDKYGDENWIKNIYFHFHPYAIFEFLVFIIAVVFLLKAL
jgi:hypothetical protein